MYELNELSRIDDGEKFPVRFCSLQTIPAWCESVCLCIPAKTIAVHGVKNTHLSAMRTCEKSHGENNSLENVTFSSPRKEMQIASHRTKSSQ